MSLSSDGNTLAVGATGEDSNATGVNGNQSNNSASLSGAAYIFRRSGGVWTQQAYLKPSVTDTGDVFGRVALSGDGNTVAVGAVGEDSAADGINGDEGNTSSLVGAVYVFTWTGSNWAQQAYVKASNSEDGDQFGYALALSTDGNTLAVSTIVEGSSATGVGGSQVDNNSSADSGVAYTFTRSGGTWKRGDYVKASNTGSGDLLASLALSSNGNTLAVGASREDSNATGINGNQSNNSATDSGAAYIYTR